MLPRKKENKNKGKKKKEKKKKGITNKKNITNKKKKEKKKKIKLKKGRNLQCLLTFGEVHVVTEDLQTVERHHLEPGVLVQEQSEHAFKLAQQLLLLLQQPLVRRHRPVHVLTQRALVRDMPNHTAESKSVLLIAIRKLFTIQEQPRL